MGRYFLIVVLIIMLPLAGAVVGFGISFGSCFKKPGCSSLAAEAMFILPISLFLLGIYILYLLRKRKLKKDYDQLKAKARAEVNNEFLSDEDALKRTILELISETNPTIDELNKKIDISKDKLEKILSQLLQNKDIQQIKDSDRLYFKRKN